jgi:cystathionine beta-lyase
MGIGVSPDDCSLVLRGLCTLGVRLAHVGRTGLNLAQHLKAFASVSRVLHSAFPECEGHEIWEREAQGYTGTFSAEVRVPSPAVLDEAIGLSRFFAIGASWGGTHSLIAPMTVDDTRKWPRVPGATYIRLSIGLEDERDLREDLDRIFGYLDAALVETAAQ